MLSPQTPPRRIAHIDMDAFFASCELRIYPQLCGVPMVVGGGARHQPRPGPDGVLRFATLRDYTGRGVLTTATYEARALGLRSAMPTMKAAKLAPDAVLLPVNFPLYRRYSALFKQAVKSICPVVEEIGIDEIYADLSDLPGDALALARTLKEAVHAATGLTCSIGIAPNKLLAKLCSDLQKPDGITLLTQADVAARVWPLAVSKVNGIGPKATQKLAALGIATLGELAAADQALLQLHFGTHFAQWLHRAAHGIDERPLVTTSEPRSISRETTFEKNLHAKKDREVLNQVFSELCLRLSEDLARKGYRAYTIGIKVRFDDFKTVTRDLTLDRAVDEHAALRKAAALCLRRLDMDRSIRLLGIRASALEPLAADKLPRPVQQVFDFD